MTEPYRLPLLIIYLFLTHSAFAQFAVVNDPDGYCNIRKSPINGDIITQLKNGTVVYGLPEPEKKWQQVDYSFDPSETGYIYTGRIDYIDKLPSIPVTHEKDNIVVLSNDKIKITVVTQKFDPANHQLLYSKEYTKLLRYIDGQEFVGTDANVPELEYKSLQISFSGKTIAIPKDALSRLYQPDLRHTIANYDAKKDILYLHSANSDGAGAYEILWVIDKKQYKTRYIMEGF